MQLVETILWKGLVTTTPNQSINLTGNSRVLKRWTAHWPAGYFTLS